MRSSYLVRGVIDGCVFWVTQNFKKRNSALKEVKMIFKQVDSSAEHFFSRHRLAWGLLDLNVKAVNTFQAAGEAEAPLHLC